MINYRRMYRARFRPWESYRIPAAASIAALLDREESDRNRPLGRALDVGCGRGQYTPELVRRGWAVVGLDYVPAAVNAARKSGDGSIEYVIGDVTRLEAAGLGTFDFFLDIGCLQGFDGHELNRAGDNLTALANPGATLLVLAFGPSRLRRFLGGLSQTELQAALPRWELISTDAALTKGLGWPMSRTAPTWYRFRRREHA